MGTKYTVGGRQIDVDDAEAVRALSEEDFAELLGLTLRSDSPRVDDPAATPASHPKETGFAFFRGPQPKAGE
ncbi:hypothetical protein [Microbacterium sediminis]|uniref:hypothetical protein n=1 Tax=Microbacterium sediminis TaxID=904291 RepID=UPI00107298E6|nr:hypothetical protein [Microbacterium sediminis]QBR75588.1 hypothetical protein E3O41_13485 [Microbacterium sediminis]